MITFNFPRSAFSNSLSSWIRIRKFLFILGLLLIVVSCSKKKENSLSTKNTSTTGNSTSTNFTPRSVHVALGLPTEKGNDNDILVIKPQYVLSYNSSKNSANWVSWELNASWYGDAPRHKGIFIPDESLPAQCLRVLHKDYTGSGFDRGHMVRSEERTRNDDDNKSTFLLSNILPQYHDLNAGPWLKLENYCETLCKKSQKELFVIAGGIYSRNYSTIGRGVAVPDTCWKIIVVLESGQNSAKFITDKTRIIAVKMPNIEGIISEDWLQYRVSVRSIEESTGFNFLSALSPELQDILEKKVDSGSPTILF